MSESDAVIRQLLDRAQVVNFIGEESWVSVRRSFPDDTYEAWVDSLVDMSAAGIGASALIGFARSSPLCAKDIGPEGAIGIAHAAIRINRHAGPRAAGALLRAAPYAAHRLHEAHAFAGWLSIVEELAEKAPESTDLVLDRTDHILSRLDLMGFRGWVAAGLRIAAATPEQRIAYFTLQEINGLRAFEQAASDIVFPDVERKLKAYLMALWHLHPIVRTATIQPAKPAPRRTTFDGPFIRIPEIYSGYRGHAAERLYRAALAHVGAHMVFTRVKFPVGTLKPVQMALVSLIEDARVEALAMREYPGLRRLWGGFHTARPHNALVAELLMARLSRALIDPDYQDDDPWVNKGKAMFFEHQPQWTDPSVSRKIGGLLGNDIGQMRIQFNAKTHVVEPAYRDDNLGLWDFGDEPPEQAEEAEAVLEAFRVRRTENESDPHHRQRNVNEGDMASMAARMQAVEDDAGVPVAKYPEWDYVIGRDRTEWATILEFEPQRASTVGLDRILHDYSDVENRILKLVRSARISRPTRVRRRPEGDRLDIESCIRATIDYRTGITPDPRVYETSELRDRDLSVLVLLDISESTKEPVKGTTTSVLSVERAATALLAQAMSGLGDPFAIHAFCSNGRQEVRYYKVKEFGQPYDMASIERLAGLRGGLSTRIGAALRHAGHEIRGQQSHRRLVLVITDGEPSDIDVNDRKYLVEDTRKAVQALAHEGIDVFCVGLDSGGDSYLTRIFGRRNVVQIDRIEALPEKLPMLYLRLTA